MFDLRLTPGDSIIKFETMSNNFVNETVNGVDLERAVLLPVITSCRKKRKNINGLSETFSRDSEHVKLILKADGKICNT